MTTEQLNDDQPLHPTMTTDSPPQVKPRHHHDPSTTDHPSQSRSNEQRVNTKLGQFSRSVQRWEGSGQVMGSGDSKPGLAGVGVVVEPPVAAVGGLCGDAGASATWVQVAPWCEARWIFSLAVVFGLGEGGGVVGDARESDEPVMFGHGVKYLISTC